MGINYCRFRLPPELSHPTTKPPIILTSTQLDPYINKEEINEVIDSLKSGWITTGPKVIELQ